jgi:toxin ParE1/3/4
LWTDRALARLDEQAGFIAAESPGAARRMLEQVFMRVEALAEMPRSGRAYPGADDLDLRELVVGPTA